MKRIGIALLLGSVVVSGALKAADIYRWVDDQGRTHLSDVVPDRYRDSAVRVEPHAPQPTPEQQREAQERAERDRLRSTAPEPAPPTGPTTVAVPAPPAKRPADSVTATTSCETWWRLFRESQDCFGAFRTVSGGIKPEAFERCNEIPNPEPRCGPYRH